MDDRLPSAQWVEEHGEFQLQTERCWVESKLEFAPPDSPASEGVEVKSNLILLL